CRCTVIRCPTPPPKAPASARLPMPPPSARVTATAAPRPAFSGRRPWWPRRLQRAEGGVEGGAGAHGLRHARAVGAVVTADVHRLALHRNQFPDDLRFVVRQRLGQWCEA